MIQVEPEPHLFTVEQYLSLDIPERTELLGGIIYDVSRVFEPHSRAGRRLVRALILGLDGSRYEVSVQDPIAVDGWTGKWAPQVDVAVIAAKQYDRTPTGSDAFALIEVSDSTYTTDRSKKIPVYVGAGVPSWIVNIPQRQVERYLPGEDLNHPTVFRDAFEVLGIRITVAELLD